jgi:drug/metabolite transporter (DMT)-like permease
VLDREDYLTTGRCHLLPLASLVLAMLLWASSFVALKMAFQGYHPMQVIFGRMFIASLFCLAFLRSLRTIRWRRSDLKLLLIMAVCEPCLYFLFEAQALQWTSASQAGMITAMLPLLVAVFAWIMLKENLSRQTLLGFALAIAGAIWLSLGSEPTTASPQPLLGNLCEFLAMVCAAGYTVSLKRLSSHYPPFFLTAFQAFIGCLFYFPFLWLPNVGVTVDLVARPSLAILYLGLVVTVGAYGCYNFGVSRIPASQAAAFVNLIPVFSVLFGMVILGERLNLGQGLACGVVFSGVWLSSTEKTARRKQPAAA